MGMERQSIPIDLIAIYKVAFVDCCEQQVNYDYLYCLGMIQ